MVQRIGLVEDDERVRHALARVIARSPEFSLWFESGSVSGATSWMRACPTDGWPEIWLVDLGLPDGSGLEVIREALRLHPKSHVMVVSVFGDEEKVLDSIASGASGYLLKGERDEDLLLNLRDLLRGGSPMSPLIARQVLNRMRALSGSSERERRPTASVASDEGDHVGLTRRESETLDLISRGYSYDEVAQELSMSANTVRHHIRSIYAKLGVHSKVAAVNEARRRNWLVTG